MPDIRRAISIPSMPSKMNRQTLMFSATFPSEIQRLAGEFLNNYLHLQVREGVEKIDFFLGKSPKLWLGGGQES